MTFLYVTGDGRKVCKQTKTLMTSGSATTIPALFQFEGPVQVLEQMNPTVVTPAGNAPVTQFGYKIDPVFQNVVGLTLTVATTGTTVTAEVLAVLTN